MKKLLLGGVVATFVFVLSASFTFAAGGFDQYGYNDTARIFNGTGSSWCLGGGQVAGCMGTYSNDKLVMKWNEAWDTCNAGGDCTGAWTNNEWNGKVKGGSGEVWKYKIVWVGGNCGADGTSLSDGGYCIWGNYETIMDQGTFDGTHAWYAHATPNGYGAK